MGVGALPVHPARFELEDSVRLISQTVKSATCLLGFFLTVLLVAAPAARGQEVTAGITGIVTDSSGAPLVGATVTATDHDRGTSYTAHTDSDGSYNITRIPVGNYGLKVEAAGFEAAVVPPFTLVLNQTARVDVPMKVGTVSQSVEVTAESTVLQTQSTEISNVFDARGVESLPLAGRNYLQLTLLSPGVTTVNPSGISLPQNMLNAGRPQINGNREQADLFLLDGQINSEDKNDEVGFTPNIDAVQEFNVITQNASAEFGNYEGGIISASIKSGTNHYHGDVFEFLRNDALNSNLPSNGWTIGLPADSGPNRPPGFLSNGALAKPEFRYNMFGGTLGGPIIKNKLFFFVDYQGLREVSSGATQAQLLSANDRAGNFADLCVNGFAAGICTDAGADSAGNPIALNQLVVPNSGGPITGAGCPATPTTYYPNPALRPACGGANPTAVAGNNLAAAGFPIGTVASSLFAMTKLYPLPQLNTMQTNNFIYNSGNEFNADQGDGKVDYVLSDKDRFFFRWSQMYITAPVVTALPISNALSSGTNQGSTEPLRNSVINWTHAFSPNLLNEARFGFNAVRFNESETPLSSFGNLGESLGITGANLNAPGLPLISITGQGNGNANLGNIDQVQIFHSTQIQAEDIVSWTHDRHSFTTGFQYIRDRQDFLYEGNSDGALGTLNIGTATGSGLADFWLGLGAGGGTRDAGGAVNGFKLRGNIVGAFVQDDWRITSTITLNLGIRFEDHTPYYEVNNNIVNFNYLTGAVELPNQDGENRALYKNYFGRGDWQPRIGIAWAPAFLHGNTVIRAGYGISSFQEGGGSNEELTQNPPFFGATQTQIAGPLTDGFGGVVPVCTAPVFSCYAQPGFRIRVFQPNLQPALAQQWNLTVQQKLNKTTTFQIGYVGQHGTHLLNFGDLSQRVPLNAQGGIAQPGQPIVSENAGPFLGGAASALGAGSVPCGASPSQTIDEQNAALQSCGTPGSLFQIEQGRVPGTLSGTSLSNAIQRYDSLQAVLQKRMGNGLEGQVAYTYSKCLTNSVGYFGTGFGSTGANSSGGQPGWENQYDSHSMYGPCYWDQTHIFTGYVSYDLPFGRGKQFGHDMNPVVNALIGNWQIGGIMTIHSGNALTMNTFGGWANSQDPSDTAGISWYTLTDLPDCNGPVKILNQHVAANPSTGTPAYIQWFDPSNISYPAPRAGELGHFGTCSVGDIRGPVLANFDLDVHKGFSFGEIRRLEFRAEFLNAFNHPIWDFSGGPANGSFDPPGPGQTQANFGRITGSQGARNVQLALKFYF
jgi:hypothetical protein